jgi:hypothetical protein
LLCQRFVKRYQVIPHLWIPTLLEIIALGVLIVSRFVQVLELQDPMITGQKNAVLHAREIADARQIADEYNASLLHTTDELSMSHAVFSDLAAFSDR